MMSVDADHESMGPAWADRTVLRQSDEQAKTRYAERARAIIERHNAQTIDQVEALRRRYAEPIFGKVRVWELIEKLGSCVDPTDERLYTASQQVHVLQMLQAMEADNFDTPEMVLVALVHDLGKVLLLTGEDPANVVCMNRPIAGGTAGAGLDRTVIQWNHDEFAYERLRDHLPDELAWLVRYHSLDVEAAAEVMNEQDLERANALLLPFAHYDHATKSPFDVPVKSISGYREVIEAAFPRRIRF
jgi:hypothetical protein